jgi:hypothetical protein
MNRMFRAFTGNGSLRHEVHGTFCGRSSTPQGRTRSVERADGEVVRPFERSTLEGVHADGREAGNQCSDAVLRVGSKRTGRRGYRPRFGTYAPGRSHNRPGYRWRAAAIAGLSACALSACGGGQGSAPANKPSVATPASAPVVASSPVTSASTAPTPTASAPVVASNPTSASPPQVASAPVPASTPVLQVAVFGDDAMAGVGGPEWWTRISPDEADALQMLLQNEFNDTGITLGNNARGGTASSLMNMLDGMDGSGAPFTAILAEIPAPIVIDNHAVNDALGGETLSDYSGYLEQFIEDVRAAGKIPVLEEPGPVCDGNHPQLGAYRLLNNTITSRASQGGAPT